MKIYSLPQAAEMLDVDYVGFWRWAKQGRIPTIEVGKNRLGVMESDLKVIRSVLKTEGRSGVLDGLLSPA